MQPEVKEAIKSVSELFGVPEIDILELGLSSVFQAVIEMVEGNEKETR